ncbi:MAG: hypothetical protein ACREI8_06670 [Myxococcota bacterium]
MEKREEHADLGVCEGEAVSIERLLVSCTWCRGLHPVENPLEFNPVCPSCAGRYLAGSLEMKGSYPLSHDAIDSAVTRTSAGTFALGYMDGAVFVAFYVGRSDSDVKHTLHDWVGMPSRYRVYAPSSKAACGSRHRGPLPFDVPALARVGMNVESSYTRFSFRYARSAEAAFEEECRNYHDLGGSGGLDNEGPPRPTPGLL